MLKFKTILIVEDNAYAALDLAAAVEERGGTVAGPVSTADDALAIVARMPVCAAIVDADVANIAMLAQVLDKAGVPLVVQAGSRIKPGIAQRVDPAGVLYRPVDPDMVVSMLSIAIGKAGQRGG